MLLFPNTPPAKLLAIEAAKPALCPAKEDPVAVATVPDTILERFDVFTLADNVGILILDSTAFTASTNACAALTADGIAAFIPLANELPSALPLEDALSLPFDNEDNALSTIDLQDDSTAVNTVVAARPRAKQ